MAPDAAGADVAVPDVVGTDVAGADVAGADVAGADVAGADVAGTVAVPAPVIGITGADVPMGADVALGTADAHAESASDTTSNTEKKILLFMDPP